MPNSKEFVINSKLDFLLNHANIGSYNKCEFIEIFGLDKEKKEAFNIYTLVVFENTRQLDIKELMTEKPKKFKGHKNLSWGIQRRIVDIDVAQTLYLQLLKNNQFIIDKPLEIGKVKLLQEQYVPPREDMYHEIQLNNILKNNFKNGSYIFEFFDEEKNNVKYLLDDPSLLNKLSEDISSIFPIKIGTASDRLGNIIFQLPINNFELNKYSILENNPMRYRGIKLEIFPRSETFYIQNLVARLYEENSDKIITRQRFISINDTVTNIDFDDCFGTNVELIDKNTSLLLYKCKFYIPKRIHSSTNIIENQNRVFKVNGNIHRLQVSTNSNNFVIGNKNSKSFDEWVRNRKYDQELKELEKTKSFIQYFGNEGEKAFNDVRELINKHGGQGVYLWDPYLSALDIKNTLYYCSTTYVQMKAISGLKQHNRKEQAKSDMIIEFEKDKKEFLFLNLEVRGKVGANGYDFHDRFLIFPLEQPRVWSLGISVNQLGGSHHILHKVQNAQHILNAFNKLWNELNNEECLVWNSN
ncbi:VPA1262 family N-terminal domain-containing protein [Pseudoalteromonas rhizosphaerae]|uniref:VPA1262 family N-terminal domain-containing protein n=1 Tax=Pseudoalteromonas rhizosphaerae TaxID=2518973 RepID=UPI003850C8CA